MYRFILIFFLFLCTINAQNGIVKSYYPDNKLKSQLSYVHDVLEGTCYWYFENGNLQEEKRYDQGKLNGWCKKYYQTGLLEEEMYVKDGYRDGLTKYYYENGGLKEVKNFENGRLLRSIQISFDENYQAPIEAYKMGNRQIDTELLQELFLCEVEICPIPVGGIAAIQEKVVYPEHAKMYGLEGIVVVIAAVSKEGFVTDCSIIKGIGLGCDEAAINAVKNTRFIPGQEKGEIVESNVSLKVEFKLSDKSVLTLAKNDDTYTKENSENFDYYSSPKDQSITQTKTGFTNNNTNETDTLILYMQQKWECNAQTCPVPVGGIKQLLNNLTIPQTIKRLKLSGDVVVLTTIDEYGNVRDTKVLTKLGHGADEAVEVAILDTHFTPGIINKQNVRCEVKITVPIRVKD
ncbi:MAG: TonB family protein [bacterium]